MEVKDHFWCQFRVPVVSSLSLSFWILQARADSVLSQFTRMLFWFLFYARTHISFIWNNIPLKVDAAPQESDIATVTLCSAEIGSDWSAASTDTLFRSDCCAFVLQLYLLCTRQSSSWTGTVLAVFCTCGCVNMFVFSSVKSIKNQQISIFQLLRIPNYFLSTLTLAGWALSIFSVQYFVQ